DPGTCQADERWFDHLIIIYEVSLPDLVEGHLNPAAKLGQDHDLQVLIFEKECMIGFWMFFVQDLLNYRMRIHHPTASLVYAVLEENWIFFWFTDSVRWDHNVFFPHRNIVIAFHLKRL